MVFINNEGNLLLFSKEVHWEAKNSFKIFAFSTIFVIVSPDIKELEMPKEFNVIQKVIQNDPIDFWICAVVIKNLTFI